MELEKAYTEEKIKRLQSVLDQFIQHVAKLEDYIDELESRISDLEGESQCDKKTKPKRPGEEKWTEWGNC